MRTRMAILFSVAFSVTGCHGQGNSGSFSYKLRKPQNHHAYSTLHSMPNGALLVVTKRVEQPKQIWHLRRIAAWDASRPREDQLDVDVGQNDELLGWELQEDRYDRDDQLLMDPAGNYLVVRWSQNADTWNQNPHQSPKPLRSVLNIIDLHGFKLLSRVIVTDPLLAAGDMGFSSSGDFVVSGLQEHRSATIGGNWTDSGQYAVKTLTLPGLKPETVCSYTLVNNPYRAQTPSTPEERRRIEKEHHDEVVRMQEQDQAATEACRPKLAPLGFSSLDDLRKSFDSFGMRLYSAEHSANVPPQSPWGCQFENLSRNLKYALFDCDERRVHLTFFSWYRGFRVFDLGSGKQLMDLKRPHSPEFSGVIATSSGVTYVVLLRDGAELEGYRIP
ncbi:MAG TPA: hypothetical protein VK789_00455 [Bryobacteraceae bacterium]|nr:hypothetical protein [Bryobacteraceae bacterium]